MGGVGNHPLLPNVRSCLGKYLWGSRLVQSRKRGQLVPPDSWRTQVNVPWVWRSGQTPGRQGGCTDGLLVTPVQVPKFPKRSVARRELRIRYWLFSLQLNGISVSPRGLRALYSAWWEDLCRLTTGKSLLILKKIHLDARGRSGD